MRTSRSFLPVALVLLLACVLPVRPAAAADPSAFMSGIGNRVIDIINDHSTSDAQHKEQFLELAEQSFDIPKIAQFVLGRYWRTASDQEKTQFLAAFTNYMVQVYWSRFRSYAGETFQVTGTKDEGNGTTLVTTDILRPESGQPPVKVDWALVPSGPSFKIRDASLEGVSQALTYRDEFAAIIERNGGKVSDLIAQLNDRVKG